MNIDIRLSLGFLDHPKTKKLQKRLGEAAVLCLLRLWMWAAENRPTGKLTGMDSEDVELAAGWTGDDGVFFRALTDCRWMDVTDDGLMLHGWEEHQAYASKSEERSASAKKAAEARWAKREHMDSNADSCGTHAARIEAHAESNAPETRNQKPSIKYTPPLPPSQGETVRVSDQEKKEPYTQEFDVFWKRYPRKVGKDAAFRAWKTKKREGHLPAMPVLLKAIDDALRSEQWQRDGGQYIPHPATWLNQGRWMDEEVQEQQLVPVTPIRRPPPPPELLRPDVKPEINEETMAKIQAMKETLARRKAVAI